MNKHFKVGVCLALPLLCSPLFGQEKPGDLTDLTLEELMSVTVTSASKRTEKLSETAAAMYVITQEDIRRSGANSIPEVLRMVPGMQVARIDGNKWAISARGFNGRFANKLLVLIDGRTVYSPLFSGVYWDAQDVLMEDVQRIEVIRGPGATLWGANAVNGVINIITKSANESQGGMISAGGGSKESPFGSARYGTQLDSNVFCKVYVKGFKVDNNITPTGTTSSDKWSMYRGGGSVDWNCSPNDLLTVQGDLYSGSTDHLLTLPLLFAPYSNTLLDETNFSGGNIIGRWERTISGTANLKMQGYFDHTYRNDLLFGEHRNTFDLDFQHGFSPNTSHKIVWGIGYRLTSDNFEENAILGSSPHAKKVNLANVFLQDEITLVERTLFLTVGSKFEYNDYTRLEFQPNIRLVAMPDEHHTVWAAISRAVRTPSRSENNIMIPISAFPTPQPGLTAVVSIFGNENFRSECLTAYELGYRFVPSSPFSVDFATFYNVYDHLRTAEQAGAPTLRFTGTTPFLSVPLTFDNQMRGETYGAELALSWHPCDIWKLNSGVTFLGGKLRQYATSTDTTSAADHDNNPLYQFSVRSYLNLSRDVELDALAYFVDKLPNRIIPAYLRLDVRVGWKVSDNLSLSVVGQNLTHAHHQEFGDTPLGEHATLVQRAVVGTVTWRF